MIYVAVAEAAALIGVAFAFAGVLRGLTREHARERNLILNQLLHLAGRTWEPPPAQTAPPDDEFDVAALAATDLPDPSWAG